MLFPISPRRLAASVATLLLLPLTHGQSIPSPDGKLTAEFHLTPAGSPEYSIQRDGKTVLQNSRLGLIHDDADFSTGLRLVATSKVEPVESRYEILTAKRRQNLYRANRQVFHLESGADAKLDIIFQVSNDGVAFRYFFPGTPGAQLELKEEVTSFHFPAGAKAWLQPMSVAKGGYGGSNPAYEEYHRQEIPVGTPSPLGAGWVYPALFRTGDTWVLLSEGSLPRNYCATRLRNESPDGEYSVGFPDPRESFHGGPVAPESRLPWLTPWRIVVVGSLKTIAESMLGVDLADPPTGPVDLKIKPGKAAWSWPLLGDGSANFETQKRFIDYAADMGWAYCLIDAWWDKQIGYDRLKQLADYAATKHVGLLLWYNSAGDWNTVKQTPRDKLLTHADRVKEFDRLKAMGIKGLKIDFFGGDGQSVIGYYHDILEDAAPYGFLLNFHGTTLPRGWERTYPHLMTMEAIRGEEYVTFEQKNADSQPTHAAMLPFTRNVFDPMDFTPVVLDKLPRCARRTTGAFELALAVLFTSGIQHYAEIPEGMAKMPDSVRDFMKRVPSVWDDTIFLDGYPGKFVVLARRNGATWYVAGINGEAAERKLTLDLHVLRGARSGAMITDGDGALFQQQAVKLPPDGKFSVTMKPNGGFVLTLE